VKRFYPVELIHDDEDASDHFKHTWSLAVNGEQAPLLYKTNDGLSPAQALIMLLHEGSR
jgi:hypothetical protein